MYFLIIVGCLGASKSTEIQEDTSHSTANSDQPETEECPRYIAPESGASALDAGSFSPRVIETVNRTGRCLVVEDLDGDRQLDILSITGIDGQQLQGVLEVWWGDGSHSTEAWPELPSPDNICTVVDIDADGDFDLLTGTGQSVVVLRNVGDQSWQAPQTLLELSAPDQDWLDLLAVIDLDGQGGLDLLVGTGVRLAEECVAAGGDPGDGGDVTIQVEHPGGTLSCFVEEANQWVTAGEDVCPSTMQELDSPQVLAMHAADLNNDARPELFLAADFSPNLMLLSRQGGLDDVSAESGLCGYDHAMGTAMADFNGDGLRDLYVTDVGPDAVYFADGCITFYDASLSIGTAVATDRSVSWGAVAQDFDLDGDADIFASVSVQVSDGGFNQPLCELGEQEYAPPGPMLHISDGVGGFEHIRLDAAAGTPSGKWYTITAASGDIDRDGDIDVVTTSEQAGLHIWENQGPYNGHWLSVRPYQDGRIVVGARIVLRQAQGERMQDLYGTFGTGGHSEFSAHFGLGQESQPVTVEIRWPDGEWSSFENVQVDQHIDLHREQSQ